MLTETALLMPTADALRVCCPVAPVGQARPQPDALRRLIGRIDDVLRWWYGVHEYSPQNECLLRVALGQTGEAIWLTDGSRLPPGTEVLDLHLWNERLCLLPPLRNGFGRAAALRRHMTASLVELARHIATDATLQRVAAIRARTALVPKRRIDKLLRVATAFGFEPAAVAASKRSDGWQIRRFCEDLVISALAWAFNPEALRHNGWRRQPYELWISRTALLSAYGPAAELKRNAGRPLGPGQRDCRAKARTGHPSPGRSAVADQGFA
ncbi:MAG TPA: hypothetical protein VG651_08205 [Stellaceae bacterium]|nr:hypothetical protein [Stellaceae bacterium]